MRSDGSGCGFRGTSGPSPDALRRREELHGAMSENETAYAPPPPGFTPPTPPPPTPPRPALRRTSGDDKVIGGVAAGIARSLGIDPILVRVAFVVLAIFGGSGVLLYLAGWLFIPEDGRTDSMGERFFRNHGALGIAAAVVLGVLVAGPLLAWGLWGDGPGFGGVVLLFLVVAAVVALSRRGDGTSGASTSSPVPQGLPSALPEATSQAPTVALPLASPGEPGSPTLALPTAPTPPPPIPKPPREKSVLGRLTIGVLLLLTGILIALDVADVINVDAVTVVAAALAVVATGLLVGTFVGRSRGLIALGVALVLVLIPLAALPNGVRWNTGAGAGERVYRVTAPEDLQTTYELGVGQITLDLRKLDPSVPLQIDASVGIGELKVLLPKGVDVTATANVAVGTINMPGERPLDGVDVTRTWESAAGTDFSAGSLELTLSTGLGQIDVIEDTVEVVR